MPGRSIGLMSRVVWCVVLALWPCLLPASPASAQQDAVLIDIQREFLGIGGAVQFGKWTPVRLDLYNASAQPIDVTCRWLLTDDDGDRLVAERSVTLNSQRTQGVWLYANPPMSSRQDETWVFRVVSNATGELVAQAQVQLSPSGVVQPSVNLVGVCGDGSKDLGLAAFTRWATQHEQLRLLPGLNLETLPDRWYGLDGLSALVWYQQGGGEPNSNRMSEATRQALREWVGRGGHLVVVLPYAGEQWTSPDGGFADLFEPLGASTIHQTQARPPLSVFGVGRTTDAVPALWFDLDQAPGYTSLGELAMPAQDEQGNPTTRDRPFIVGHRFGFGQVTLVGLDLSDKQVLLSLDEFRRHRIWTRIFSWRGSKDGELLPSQLLDDPQTADQFIEARNADHIELGSWIAGRVARQKDTVPTVMLALLLFVVYAVVAALTFPGFLRSRGLERHSWMVFVGIVLVFSAIAWGGAWAMRPSGTTAAHFTVLDIDGNRNVVHARSWQSLLIPSFTTAEIAIPSEPDGFARMELVNLLSSPGLNLAPESPGYPDQRTYPFDALAPHQLNVPMRSTTKSLVIDYLGHITARREGMDQPWTLPQASLRIANNGMPAGTITHRFPGELTDVVVIYCPGGAQQQAASAASPVPDARPYVYEYRKNNQEKIDWEPGVPLVLPATAQGYQYRLWRRPGNQRDFSTEGYLGRIMEMRGDSPGSASDSHLINDLALLSFYDTLPPPIYERKDLNNDWRTHTYSRSMARDLDLTPLITGRRIIIIGHLRSSPSPVPMTVDGDEVESDGWTVVRWIYDL